MLTRQLDNNESTEQSAASIAAQLPFVLEVGRRITVYCKSFTMVYYTRQGNPTALERKRQFEEELIYYDADSNSMTTSSPAGEHRGTSTTPFSPGVRPRVNQNQNQNQYKRQRKQTTRTSSSPAFPSISSLSSSSSPSPSLRAVPRSKPAPATARATTSPTTVKVKIKTEGEANARAAIQERPLAERVQIYIGPQNKVFTVGIRDLDKSPVLKALVHHGVASGAAGSEGPFIMHPELTKIDANHFQPVFQFLLMDEYVPTIISNPKGANVFPKQLDGLVTVGEYQAEALRGGYIYVIAKALGMRGLEDLVLRKITQAQYLGGGGGYGVKCLLDLAMVVFSRPEENELAKRAKHQLREDDGADGGDGLAGVNGRHGMGQNDGGEEEVEDRLELWLIESLKDKLQQTLINHAKLFFMVANHGACARRGFAARIFRRKVEDWEKLGGDVVAIEDDD
ncbi:hypothetical protein HRR83_000959 [Exophiala dermatitidis]|nr:hypothetical protein HRR74_000963 [Exophiala dermatitidis]KAJ4528841.1 hypothetical protein HRR73_001464 [Exophiala dermatitidis]KAJ4530232.1 hypothetical protein HRR76_009460 [Exophiala dermatitidis]KAJ4558998.1 hypothetical protein HRR77_000962 [Exophiala dermatitidis]KAJ4590705.1 hypothetical protein HRR82_001045 [Exophiala dermatitidis]